jgi:hypothetical protein
MSTSLSTQHGKSPQSPPKEKLRVRLSRWKKERSDALFLWWLRHPYWFTLIVVVSTVTSFYWVVCFYNDIHNIQQTAHSKIMFDELLAVAGVVVGVMFGVIGWFGSVAVEKVQTEMRREISSLSDLNTKLGGNITNLEEVVRLRLHGIPEILGRAIHLVDHAMDELFVVTFTVRFGAVHRVAFEGANDVIVTIPGAAERLNFEEATSRFWERIQQRIVDIRSFRLLTVAEDARRAFATDLKQREGYANLDIERAFKDMNESWDTINTLAGRRGRTIARADLRTIATLPFQMILARLRPEPGDTKARYACLVFLVGSNTAQMTEAAAGFYTELDDFIEIYRNVAETLFAAAPQQATPQQSMKPSQKFDIHIASDVMTNTLEQQLMKLDYRRDGFAGGTQGVARPHHFSFHPQSRAEFDRKWKETEAFLSTTKPEEFFGFMEGETTAPSQQVNLPYKPFDPKVPFPFGKFQHEDCPPDKRKDFDIHISADRNTIDPRLQDLLVEKVNFYYADIIKPTGKVVRVYTFQPVGVPKMMEIFQTLADYFQKAGGLEGKIKLEVTLNYARFPLSVRVPPIITKLQESVA